MSFARDTASNSKTVFAQADILVDIAIPTNPIFLKRIIDNIILIIALIKENHIGVIVFSLAKKLD